MKGLQDYTVELDFRFCTPSMNKPPTPSCIYLQLYKDRNWLCKGNVVNLSVCVCVSVYRMVVWHAPMCLVQEFPVCGQRPLVGSAALSAQGFVFIRGQSMSPAPPSLRPLIPARHAHVWSVWQFLPNIKASSSFKLSDWFHPSSFSLFSTWPLHPLPWSEWGGELSEETLSSPVLPSSPFRYLLPRLRLVSLWGCCPLSQSHLHILLQPLPALHLCQRHRHLCATGLPSNTLRPTSYQARTVLPWVHRYFLNSLCEWHVKDDMFLPNPLIRKLLLQFVALIFFLN